MRKCAVLAAVLLVSCKASAPPAIAIDNGWARSTVAGQSSAAAYLTIRNTGSADRLTSVSATIGDASLHSSSMDNGIMRMRPLEALDIPEESTVKLKPGGVHVMITRVKAPLSAGETFALELDFEKSGERQVTVNVRPATAGGEAM